MTAGDSRSAPSDAPADRLLRRALSEAGLEVEVGPGRPEGRPGLRCHVLAFAASGAMALTGWPAEPAWPKGDLIGALSAAGCLVEELSAALGRRVAVEPGRALCARVGPAGASGGRRRRGRASAGGSCRLLRASDGWVALNLGRPDDVGLLPALTLGRVDPSPAARGGLCAAGQTAAGEAVWDGLALEAAAGPARRFAQGAWELGLPASVLGEATPAGAPWLVERVGTPGGRQRRRPRVVDFTALWAGPLCAHLLGRAGARVVAVEAVDRPDGARAGDPALFDALHRGGSRLVVDFAAEEGRRRVHELVAEADVVLEASRPRALAALGLDPRAFLEERPGRTWVSITGYGRGGEAGRRVAFGDDAAVAGGLVAADGRGDPVFCGDAAADPVTGLYAAVAALASLVSGGGNLVDCSMAGASAFANGAPGCTGEHLLEGSEAGGWRAVCDGRTAAVAEPGGTRRPRLVAR
ncbi:MAG TPA: CoA transferase [Acidimicrobiales bacterium]|nr:CoA transferase [Acidimicrobiales bacterium]